MNRYLIGSTISNLGKTAHSFANPDQILTQQILLFCYFSENHKMFNRANI